METLKFNVNQRPIEIHPVPGEMLSAVLRDRLKLTGTKIGCDELECGSCTVLLDGEAVLSCVYPARKAEGKQVVTIEGLASNGTLHPLQDAFIQHGAVQCGFCIPGQIMTAAALLGVQPTADGDTIRAMLKDTLCRCAGYPTLVRAIQAAGESIQSGAPVKGPALRSASSKSNIGRVVARPDALEKVNGEALFTDDYVFPGMLHARVLRANTPHAVLVGLDVSKAMELPGVIEVLIADDIPGQNSHGIVIHDWPVLVGIGEKIRYIGDALALVAAESRVIETQALELIKVEFDRLPVITDPVLARENDAIAIHENGNLLKHITVRKGDVTKGFAEADVVLEGVFTTPMTEQAFMEPECSIAKPTPEGRMEIYVGSQIPYADRDQIARTLGLKIEQVRVIGTLVGGGFGGKEDIAGQIHAALLAQRTNRPVKLLFDRNESLVVHPKRHPTQIRVRLGAKSDGLLVAAETELYGDTGAYASLGEKVMTRATTHSSGPYIVPHVSVDCYAMYTNNPPAGAFRGFGVTQSAFAIESLLDMLAENLGIDPIEIRMKNALRVGAETNTGQLLTESVGLIECIQKVKSQIQEKVGHDDLFAARRVDGLPNLRRAWGIAAAYKNTGLGGGAPDKSIAEVELYADGSVEVRTSAAEIGQGLNAVLQIIASEALSVPMENVRVLLSDTDLTPDGGPTTASRQTYMAGNAVMYAAKIVQQAMATSLAEKYDVPPKEIKFVEGLAHVNGHAIAYGDVVGLLRAEGRQAKATYEYLAPETQPLGTGGDMHFAYSFAAQAAEVEVDIETGQVYVLNIIAATDVGRVINPLGLLGQVEGGVMMGIGNALTEEFILEEGLLFSDRLARYRMPSFLDTPAITSIIVEHPTHDGPFGAKGVGEISSIPTTPAITNAIYYACGIRIRHLPVDQDWLALEILKKLETE